MFDAELRLPSWTLAATRTVEMREVRRQLGGDLVPLIMGSGLEGKALMLPDGGEVRLSSHLP